MSDAPTGDPTGTDAAAGGAAGEDAAGSESDARGGPVEPDATDVRDPILSIDGLTKRFGGITAVDGVNLEVERGSITGLIGPNGAGKSTTFDLVTGFLRPDAGSVHFDGRPITGLAPHKVARAGAVRTFQITREFPEMTVLENLMVAPPGQRGESLLWSVAPGTRRRVVAQEREVAEEVWRTLDRFELDHLADEYASALSGGQRKLLELARALLTDPQLLLLDEPMAGVNPSLETKLLDHVHELREQGRTFLLVEHDIDLIMEHCDRVIVMHQGDVLAAGPPETIREDERVIEAYLGEDV